MHSIFCVGDLVRFFMNVLIYIVIHACENGPILNFKED